LDCHLQLPAGDVTKRPTAHSVDLRSALNELQHLLRLETPLFARRWLLGALQCAGSAASLSRSDPVANLPDNPEDFLAQLVAAAREACRNAYADRWPASVSSVETAASSKSPEPPLASVKAASNYRAPAVASLIPPVPVPVYVRPVVVVTSMLPPTVSVRPTVSLPMPPPMPPPVVKPTTAASSSTSLSAGAAFSSVSQPPSAFRPPTAVRRYDPDAKVAQPPSATTSALHRQIFYRQLPPPMVYGSMPPYYQSNKRRRTDAVSTGPT
jgi:hypothetical protein